MYNGGKIVLGLVAFLVLVTFPIWYTAAGGASLDRPEIVLPEDEKACVESKEYMRAWHMDLLDDWRDAVVRDGHRVYVSEDGQKHRMSLSLGCMTCHDNKAEFCDKCHDYTGVSPYCWDCHVEPEQKDNTDGQD